MIVDTTVKQVAIVLQGKPRTKQELCVECATAFLGAYTRARDTHKGWAEQWNNGGYMKIVLKCPDREKFDSIFSKVVTEHMPFASSNDIFVIGPAPASIIDPITTGMKLL